MSLITTKQDLATITQAWRSSKKSIVLVPTMGALHEGHLTLIDLGKLNGDKIIVSIFVNPTQFGEGEDLETYPQNLEQDYSLAIKRGCDLIYAPTVQEIYPDGFATTISVGGLTKTLCGQSRPGHFDGVATIVTKLFNQTRAHKAVFGEKDFQQLQVIRRLVADLNLPIDLIPAPISRESDGLARSSRNINLSSSQRNIAPLLNQTLQELKQDIIKGGNADLLIDQAIDKLKTAGFEPDYLTLRDEATLSPMETYNPKDLSRLFVAAVLGTTRLIDNLSMN